MNKHIIWHPQITFMTPTTLTSDGPLLNLIESVIIATFGTLIGGDRLVSKNKTRKIHKIVQKN